jgi:UDP-glucose 4-epimerase
VEKVVFISTDKAVKPVNAMGMTKALQERIFLSDEFDSTTKFIGVRYGNIIGSRGSVVPHFVEMAKKGEALTVTHKDMTRFLLSLEDAIGLVFYALENGHGGEIFVKKSPAASITDLAEVMANRYNVEVKITEIRPGEKIHETLVQEDEMRRAKEEEGYFIIHEKGNYENSKPSKEITSENAKRLTKKEIENMLRDWL